MRLRLQPRLQVRTNHEWVKRALDAVYSVARTKPLFTSADVWVKLNPDSSLELDPRSIGPIMQRAAKLGYCSPTSQVLRSNRKTSHRRPLALWHSRILGEGLEMSED